LGFIFIYRINIPYIPFPHFEKLALFYNLNYSEVYTNFEQYVIHLLNFMLNLFIGIYSGGGGVKFMKHLGGGGAGYKSL
jgi:hypothetical protein